MEQYIVNLPKITYLTLLVSQYLKTSGYTNTNDLAKMANIVAQNLVRTRIDKEDYKFLDDTKHGGLRGNFSTQLTLRGYVKRGSRKCAFYGFSSGNMLTNALMNGQIILDSTELTAHTQNKRFADLLRTEAKLLTVREEQAHIKVYLEQHPEFPLKRDELNFPKIAVLKSKNNQHFMRILFNRLLSDGKLEYNALNYWEGSKLKRFNLHILFEVPIIKDGKISEAHGEFRAVKFEDVIGHPGLFLTYDMTKKTCKIGNSGEIATYDVDTTIDEFTDNNSNIAKRLGYNWDDVAEKFCEDSTVSPDAVKPTEFYVFLEKFLKFKMEFRIDGKTVVGMTESASGGPDVILKYKGGTEQKLELEHGWSHFLRHGHNKNSAFKGAWLYADEEFDFELIKKLFMKPAREGEFIPQVFLFTDESGTKRAKFINWKDPDPQPEDIEVGEIES